MTRPETRRFPCPQCDHRDGLADANFCSRCGAALGEPRCPDCATPSEAGDLYCTRCGRGLATARPTPGIGNARVPWAAAGLLAVLLVVVSFVRLAPGGERPGGDRPIPPPSTPPGTLGPTSAVPLSSMTPRQAATRLFDRVMRAIESGDRTEADMFLPMAIASYDRIAALSLDDRFHLSLLHAAAGDARSALAVAEAGLALRPTHLLCLAAAARAALLAGDTAKAAAHYRTLDAVYDQERGADLQEYDPSAKEGHAALLPVLRQEARAYAQGVP